MKTTTLPNIISCVSEAFRNGRNRKQHETRPLALWFDKKVFCTDKKSVGISKSFGFLTSSYFLHFALVLAPSGLLDGSRASVTSRFIRFTFNQTRLTLFSEYDSSVRGVLKKESMFDPTKVQK